MGEKGSKPVLGLTTYAKILFPASFVSTIQPRLAIFYTVKFKFKVTGIKGTLLEKKFRAHVFCDTIDS